MDRYKGAVERLRAAAVTSAASLEIPAYPIRRWTTSTREASGSPGLVGTSAREAAPVRPTATTEVDESPLVEPQWHHPNQRQSG